jgi:hypothetical protein
VQALPSCGKPGKIWSSDNLAGGQRILKWDVISPVRILNAKIAVYEKVYRRFDGKRIEIKMVVLACAEFCRQLGRIATS